MKSTQSKKNKLRDKLDAIFSKYIRIKHADCNGYCRCYTCGAIVPWTKIQCGHYMSRRFLSTRFMEQNVRPQCMKCNVLLHGEVQAYRRHLVDEIGENEVNKIEATAWNVVQKYYDFEYQELIKYYKTLFDKIKKEKGL